MDKRLRFMADLIEPLLVTPESAVRLSDHDPGYTGKVTRAQAGTLATAAILVTALHAIDPRYPAADPADRDEMARARAGLVAELGLAQPG